jgi:hypothetical protein
MVVKGKHSLVRLALEEPGGSDEEDLRDALQEPERKFAQDDDLLLPSLASFIQFTHSAVARFPSDKWILRVRPCTANPEDYIIL